MGLGGLQGWSLSFSPFHTFDHSAERTEFHFQFYLNWDITYILRALRSFLSIVLRSTVQRFFWHWRRVMNPKRLCFLKKKKHLTLSFWYFFIEYHLISPDPSLSQPANRATFCLLLWGVEIEALPESRQALEIDEAQTSGLDIVVFSCQIELIFRVLASVYW